MRPWSKPAKAAAPKLPKAQTKKTPHISNEMAAQDKVSFCGTRIHPVELGKALSKHLSLGQAVYDKIQVGDLRQAGDRQNDTRQKDLQNSWNMKRPEQDHHQSNSANRVLRQCGV
jgi:hypothetical protein